MFCHNQLIKNALDYKTHSNSIFKIFNIVYYICKKEILYHNKKYTAFNKYIYIFNHTVFVYNHYDKKIVLNKKKMECLYFIYYVVNIT